MQISYTFHISSKQHAISTAKQLSSASKHNLRKYSSPGNSTGHYDSDKIVQLVGTDNLFRDVEKVYHEQFDQVLADYNVKQKRADRRITNYMRYVSENGNSDLAVEAIIQLGDQEFWEDIPENHKRQMTYIFRDQLNALRQYIPEFAIANAVIHYDEASPHMHVIGVPVSSGYKRGLSKQCAKTRVFTKERLEILQDALRERAMNGMEKNPEIFRDAAMKPKEQGRNTDYTKEYFVQKKKEELEVVEEDLSERQYALSEIKKETANAQEMLDLATTELTRKEQETFALVPFRVNDVFPVKGKQMKVLEIDEDRRNVLMCDADPRAFYPMKQQFSLALAQKSFFEYMYSDSGLEQMRRNKEAAEQMKEGQDKERLELEISKRELEAVKEDLASLNQDIEKLSDIHCPFHMGDRFEVDGEMMEVDYIYTYSRSVTFRTQAGGRKDLPFLDAVRAYRAFMKKTELSEACISLNEQIADLNEQKTSLKEQIRDLKGELANRKLMLSEINMVWDVFDQFPSVKEFVYEVGQKLRRSFSKVQLPDVVEVFKEKVLGEEAPERSRGRSR